MKKIFLLSLFILLLGACNTEVVVRVPDEEVIPVGASQADIENAFQNKYPDWNLNELAIVVSETRENFAQGYVGPKNGDAGGGYFFAAKTATGWIIAADGNGTLDCVEIEPYNFPTDMIPECYDIENQKIITR
ncbi:MAG: hypothetical protein PHU71_03240 [Candidatus Gracilibacteria bacterium]|nr:hypothetical protein [Candidatus Gracilibacteria bacterium]